MKIKDIKGRASLHKCFALNVPEVSYNITEASSLVVSVRAFALIVVRARKLWELL